MGFVQNFIIIALVIGIISFTLYLINYYQMKKRHGKPYEGKFFQFVKKIKEHTGKFIKSIPVKKTIYITLSLILVVFIVLSFLQPSKLNDFVESKEISYTYNKTDNDQITSYTNALISYNNLSKYNVKKAYLVDDMQSYKINENDEIYGTIVKSYSEFINNDSSVSLLDKSNEIKFNVGEISAGLYNLGIDYYEITDLIDANQIDIRINGINPYSETKTLILPSVWRLESNEFKTDRYGNEIQPSSIKDKHWMHQKINDLKGLHPNLFLFNLKSNDEISIHYTNTEILIGQIYFVEETKTIDYKTYIKNYENNAVIKNNSISARDFLERTDPSIRLRADQDSAHLYYDTQFLKLNVIFSESWQTGGQTLSYKINAPETGLYEISLKYRQNLIKNLPVYRKILVNGNVPFDEFNYVAFPYTTSFINRTLVNEDNETFKIYLTKGENILSFVSVLYPYRTAIEKIKEIMSKIQKLALEVKQYTAGGTDPYRDWDIEMYFPTAKTDLLLWADELEALHQTLTKLSEVSDPAEIINLKTAASRLRQIAKDINKLPSKMIQFSDGDGSVNQLIGFIMQRLLLTPLEIESLTVGNAKDLKKPYTNVFISVWEGFKRLVLSYINNPYSINDNNKEDLIVWVNHSRQYIEIMQSLVDSKYQGEHKVTLSQMPDQNKLILSNTSGNSPDVAIGVDHWIPYDFAIRNASLDLRQFEGYEELVSKFAKGSMIPYVFEEGVYGMPETQNFWVTFYRMDILNSIGITKVPQTWDEIIEILPILQSYGLNYYVPLAQYSGMKPFVATLPFIYQFGGSLYTENGMQTAINSEETIKGIRLMSELFTLYNLPSFVASFYNNFRYGTIPIGIADLSTYILLQTVAKELDGLWNMDLHPGYLDPNTNEIVRYAASGAQSNMILSQTNKKESAFDFLSWWMSTEIQTDFAFILQSTYGKSYFWNSANLEAFEQLSMPSTYKEIILKQWEYAIEAPRIPGSYMVEREISNAWTNIVYNGVNPRQALDNSVRISNREILYKMSEFGYVENNVVIKDYPVPTIDNIDYWLKEHAR